MKYLIATLCDIDDCEIKKSPYWKTFNGKRYLRIIGERMAAWPFADKAVCALSINNDNRVIKNELQNSVITCFEGSEDRNKRLLEATIHYQCDAVIYVPIGYTAFDFELTELLIDVLKKNDSDVVQSTKYPAGLVPKMIRLNALEKIVKYDCSWPFYLHEKECGLSSYDLSVPSDCDYDYEFIAEIDQSTTLIEEMLSQRPNKSLSETLKYIWNEELLRPGNMAIEPTNHCNLKCPDCYNGDGSLTRQKGFMKYEQFCKLYNELPESIKSIALYFYGESCLNQDIWKMAHYARNRHTSLSTNGHFLSSKETIEACLGSGLNSLLVCIDGASEETFSKYRKNGNFNKVKDDLKTLCKMKQDLGLKLPEISLQFIIFQHNVHEIEKIKKISEEVGVDQLLLKRTSKITVPVPKEFELKYEEKLERFVGEQQEEIIQNCKTVIVLWDGKVVPCCYDYDGRINFGNVFKENFIEILYGRKRREFMEDRVNHTNKYCEQIECPIYKFKM